MIFDQLLVFAGDDDILFIVIVSLRMFFITISFGLQTITIINSHTTHILVYISYN